MTDPLGSPGLELRELSVGYGSSFQLNGVSFSAGRGEVVGLIGPNGGGKSTLLKAIAGVLRPHRGEVLLAGQPIRRLASRVAFVPQREEVHWDFPITAEGVVLMGRYRQAGWLRWPGRGAREASRAALERFGLEGTGGRHISQFSGGQQQRIFLARATVQDPLLVLLDEPFTGVDQENRAVLNDTIRDFAHSGAVVLMATHDLEAVAATCSSVCALNRRVVACGPTATTFTPEVLKATFGGRVAVFA